MADWVVSFKSKLVIMESSGIHWKRPYAVLEKYGLKLAFTARFIKNLFFIIVVMELSLNLVKIFCPVYIFSAIICPS